MRRVLREVYLHYVNGSTAEETANIRKNALYAVMCFYQLGAVKSGLIFEVLTELAQKITVFSIDIMSHYIQHVGAELRKEDPLKLKGFIELLETKRKASDLTEGIKKRLEYFAEALESLRNNKKQEFHDVARQKVLPLQTWLRTNPQLRSEMGSGPIEITWAELAHVPDASEPKEIEREKLKKIKVPRIVTCCEDEDGRTGRGTAGARRHRCGAEDEHPGHEDHLRFDDDCRRLCGCVREAGPPQSHQGPGSSPGVTCGNRRRRSLEC